MKELLLISFILLFFSCSGTQSSKEDKESMNDLYTNALENQIKLSNQIQQSIDKGDFISFKDDVNNYLLIIDNTKASIEKISVSPNEDEYKKSIVSAISAFRSLGEVGKKFNELNINSSEQEYNDLISEFNSLKIQIIPKHLEHVRNNRRLLISTQGN